MNTDKVPNDGASLHLANHWEEPARYWLAHPLGKKSYYLGWCESAQQAQDKAFEKLNKDPQLGRWVITDTLPPEVPAWADKLYAQMSEGVPGTDAAGLRAYLENHDFNKPMTPEEAGKITDAFRTKYPGLHEFLNQPAPTARPASDTPLLFDPKHRHIFAVSCLPRES